MKLYLHDQQTICTQIVVFLESWSWDVLELMELTEELVPFLDMQAGTTPLYL